MGADIGLGFFRANPETDLVCRKFLELRIVDVGVLEVETEHGVPDIEHVAQVGPTVNGVIVDSYTNSQ